MGWNEPATYTYAQRLSLSNFLREPALRSAIRALQLPPDSHGLDAGCGIGLQTILLAKAVGPAGHVTGLDLSPEFLIFAEDTIRKNNLSEQVNFLEGDINRLVFDDNSFDWVWCADTLYPGPIENPQSVIKEFARVVRPGGRIVILYWSGQMFLPGYPLLEARLNVAFAETAQYTREIRPALHFLRALGWLRDAGLQNLTASTFVADVHAPLSDEIQNALAMTFQMFWGETQSKVTTEVWAEFERICLPGSPDFILNSPDYYAFLTYSLFSGKVPD